MLFGVLERGGMIFIGPSVSEVTHFLPNIAFDEREGWLIVWPRR
jgi:hypothetical protein